MDYWEGYKLLRKTAGPLVSPQEMLANFKVVTVFTHFFFLGLRILAITLHEQIIEF